MIATTRLRQRVERLRRVVHWVPAAAIVALAPKCFVCLVAYTSLGTGLGLRLGGPELCGAAKSAPDISVLSFAIVGVAIGGLAVCRWCECRSCGRGLIRRWFE